ncbi:hypothetical protein [Alkaliphilus sp. B6464]|uniref:hypothetical protein n=1 Tax=Alkaliphilus sp. B6464 TaxID=2731219 RepID=UPI001BA8C6E7|nr:hypothetical protein [Alkaliphilus sp. B6464]QUH20408.1 hypothetical protein HYG84_11205 [Alkaliphilus sp. B6464]
MFISTICPIIIIIAPIIQLFYILDLLNKLDSETSKVFTYLSNLNLLGILKAIPNMRSYIVDYLEKVDIEESNRIQKTNIIVNILIRLIFYILTGILYALFLIILIINMFLNFISIESLIAQNRIFTITALLVALILFYLEPLLKYLKLDKLHSIIYLPIEKLFMYVDKFANNSIYLLGHILSFFTLMAYIYILNQFNDAYLGMNFIFFNVANIFIYLKCVGKWLYLRIFIYFDKYKFDVDNLDVLVEFRENNNYFYLVIMTMFSYMLNIFDSMLLYAITIVFLFDTYYKTHKEISSKIVKKF